MVTVLGKDSCKIIVGGKIVPDRGTSNNTDFIDVFYQSDILDIVQGYGEDKTAQSYKVKFKISFMLGVCLGSFAAIRVHF
jgi:hypothetical protein